MEAAANKTATSGETRIIWDDPPSIKRASHVMWLAQIRELNELGVPDQSPPFFSSPFFSAPFGSSALPFFSVPAPGAVVAGGVLFCVDGAGPQPSAIRPQINNKAISFFTTDPSFPDNRVGKSRVQNSLPIDKQQGSRQ
jgi:hypothetical protein